MENYTYNRPEWVDAQSYPFKDNWMLVQGHRLHYLDEGPRDKPVLLFIHPGPGWSFSYRHQIEQLRNDFRCVAPTSRGMDSPRQQRTTTTPCWNRAGS